MTPLRQRMLEELQRRLSREPDYAELSRRCAKEHLNQPGHSKLC